MESSKEEKADTKGKEKVKERKDTVSTNSQWTGGSWEQWSEQSWNAEGDTASWRDDD